MKNKITFLVIVCCIVFGSNAKAQTGALDPTYNTGTGANDVIYTTAIQSDGKVIIGGDFTSYNGVTRNRIARLNTDGSLDINFDPGTGANGSVFSIAIQSDGKIIIGGNFISFNSIALNHIVRLNNDGSIDATFITGTGTNTGITSIAIQSDGKIIIGGYFTAYNGTARNYIARLNADGTLDAIFNPGAGPNDWLFSTAIQSDGKIIIVGGFTIYDGTERNRIARLNADGSLDASFNPGTGADTYVFTTAIQSDGKIIIGGDFSFYNGTARNRIARLNTDGSLDATFNVGTGANGRLESIAIQNDGKIIIVGWFIIYNGTTRKHIARLNADGSLDATFNPGTGANNDVYSTTIQSDEKIIIGGYYTSYNGTVRNRIARILVSGVGIKENNNRNDLFIYPNPTESNVSLGFKGFTGGIKITLNNALGKLMLKENIEAVSDNFIKEIDMAKYPNGIYYIQIVNNGKAFVQMVVKL